MTQAIDYHETHPGLSGREHALEIMRAQKPGARLEKSVPKKPEQPREKQPTEATLGETAITDQVEPPVETPAPEPVH